MTLRNINKTVNYAKNNDSEMHVDISFNYEDKKYELSFIYQDEVSDDIMYVELTETENKKYSLFLYRDDKVLRVFDKKNNFSYDIVERNDDIVLDKYWPKSGVSHNYIFKDNVFYYSTSKTKEYIEGTEENFEVHKLIFDEQIDKDFILNNIKPFIKSIDKDSYKKMFEDVFKLRPFNLMEYEYLISIINNKYDDFISTVIKENVFDKDIKLKK